MRFTQSITLAIVNPDGFQHSPDFVILDKLGDGLHPHQLANFVNRLDHRIVDRIVDDTFDEHAIDFQVVHRQVFQVSKGRYATAEVIQCETTTHLLQGRYEARSRLQVRDRNRLGDFKTNLARRYPVLAEVSQDGFKKFLVGERRARKVNRDKIDLLDKSRGFCQEGAGMVKHPEIQFFD